VYFWLFIDGSLRRIVHSRTNSLETKMTKKLEDKVALVTGGTSGIGLAAALEFAAQGAQVFITGRRQAELDRAAKLIGHGVTAVESDASKLDDLDRLYAEIKRKAGHLDVVFANAGGGDMLPLGAITEEHFDRIFDSNVKGVLFTVQKALPLLRDNASIIMASSTTSIKGTANFSVYSGRSQLCPFVDSGSKGSQDSGECDRSWSDSHTGTGGLGTCRAHGRLDESASKLGADGSHRQARGNRKGGVVLGVE
jgi:NAD(P)-dependent dehydrogenase (short-subunit alcohol dehydrogenase family)